MMDYFMIPVGCSFQMYDLIGCRGNPGWLAQLGSAISLVDVTNNPDLNIGT